MKTYVLYHAGCRDGFAAAWVARSVLTGDVEYIPVNYGQPAPQIDAGSRVYVLDFCYPREQLLEWWIGPSPVGQLIILDHHKTAQEALSGFAEECVAKTNGSWPPKIVFDMTKSGGRLAWEHFHRHAPSPGLIDYIEDRDLWLWKLPHSRAVNACLRSHPLDFALWDKWSFHSAADLCSHFREPGEAILRREDQIIASHVGFAREITLAGHKVLSVNATVLTSEIAGELAKNRPFGVCWFERADGKRVYSLRSREGGIDVSEVAKQFGGGGHPQSSGFTINTGEIMIELICIYCKYLVKEFFK